MNFNPRSRNLSMASQVMSFLAQLLNEKTFPVALTRRILINFHKHFQARHGDGGVRKARGDVGPTPEKPVPAGEGPAKSEAGTAIPRALNQISFPFMNQGNTSGDKIKDKVHEWRRCKGFASKVLKNSN